MRLLFWLVCKPLFQRDWIMNIPGILISSGSREQARMARALFTHG